jgi:glutamyl-tRNA reductase
MFDNVKKKILLVGASQMAVDYLKVLDALNIETVIIGRGETSALNFFEKTGKQVIKGGLENYLNSDFENNYDAAILAVGLEELALSATQLMMHGFKKILVEKPVLPNWQGAYGLNSLLNLCLCVDKRQI